MKINSFISVALCISALMAQCISPVFAFDDPRYLMFEEQDTDPYSQYFQNVRSRRSASMIKVPVTNYPGFSDDMSYEQIAEVFEKNMRYLNKLPDSRSVYFGKRKSSVKEIKTSLSYFEEVLRGSVNDDELTARVKDTFDLYQSVGNDNKGTVLFTGYVEAEIKASLKRTEEYQYPIYGRPADLVRVKGRSYRYGRKLPSGEIIRYYTRKEIDTDGALEGRGLELAWGKEPAWITFLQIQGSGWLLHPDGTKTRILYNSSNGHSYKSIGRYLIGRGEIHKDATAVEMMEYIVEQDEANQQRILNSNPSYVFFKLSDAVEGPFGSIAVPLTPGRSIAIDYRVFPYGALSFIQTTKPVADDNGKYHGYAPVNRFTCTQDTGGAIRTPGRVDIFWGKGTKALYEASAMKANGTLYFLLAKKYSKFRRTTKKKTTYIQNINAQAVRVNGVEDNFSPIRVSMNIFDSIQPANHPVNIYLE
ncbi:murein transglycosylase A [Elusimicrobiota bacterium]